MAAIKVEPTIAKVAEQFDVRTEHVTLRDALAPGAERSYALAVTKVGIADTMF